MSFRIIDVVRWELGALRGTRRFNRLAVRNGFLVAALMALTLAGCGSKDPFPRHPIGGTVTFQGKPVERGMIVLEPTDASVGQDNMAPTGYVPILDGKYQTSRENSPTAGSYTLRVMGLDATKIPKNGLAEDSVPALFPDYVITVEIPRPENRLDIEVPDPKSGSR